MIFKLLYLKVKSKVEKDRLAGRAIKAKAPFYGSFCSLATRNEKNYCFVIFMVACFPSEVFTVAR
tara:strand:+ start:579 stop:773 length:195 start_codon:yes stop_codon:yes gene_type:complete